METGKKQVRKWFFVLLVTILIGGICCLDAAGYSGGNGTEDCPYKIADVNDLLALADTPADYNRCFILTADINMAGQVFTTAVIARDTNNPFVGVFNGAGHKIRNLVIDTNGIGNDYLGLFGYISFKKPYKKGTVKNLGLENVSITGKRYSEIEDSSEYVGGLAGYNNDGDIDKCYSTGGVSGANDVGGLVGENSGGNISNCCSTGDVDGYEYVGGLAGYCNGCITNCYSISEVEADYCVGGLVGESGGNINYCYSDGTCKTFDKDESGWTMLGGLVGWNNGGSIKNCYSACDVKCSGCNDPEYIGGLAGMNSLYIRNCYSTGDVNAVGSSYYVGGLFGSNYTGAWTENCYSTGKVYGDEDVGGLVGWEWDRLDNCYSTGKVSDDECVGGLFGLHSTSPTCTTKCFWDVNTSCTNIGIGCGIEDPNDVIGKTTDEMKKRSTFADAGWDFMDGNSVDWMNHKWAIEEDVNYPRLIWSIVAGLVSCCDNIDEGDCWLKPENFIIPVCCDIDAGDCVRPGGEITYTIVYNYDGEPNIGDINNVNIIDKLSYEVDFNSADSNGVYDSCSHTVTWNIGVLHPGDSGSVTLTVEAKVSVSPCERIRNKCEIRSGEQLLWRTDEYTNACGKRVAVVDDFESYTGTTAGDHPLRGIWHDRFAPDNSTVSEVYLSVIGDPVRGTQSMRYRFRNDADPCYSEAWVFLADLGIDSNFVAMDVKSISLQFYGQLLNEDQEPNPISEKMYIKLTDGTGAEAKVEYGDMNDIKEELWHKWTISMQEFIDVNNDLSLTDVNRITIGFAEGAHVEGQVFIDDIRLCGPRCVLSKRSADFAKIDYAPLGNPAGDCVIDYLELTMMANEWLTDGIDADLIDDENVNFRDFAILADMWLEEEFWPYLSEM